jgi:hypothetical protein
VINMKNRICWDLCHSLLSDESDLSSSSVSCSGPFKDYYGSVLAFMYRKCS